MIEQQASVLNHEARKEMDTADDLWLTKKDFPVDSSFVAIQRGTGHEHWKGPECSVLAWSDNGKACFLRTSNGKGTDYKDSWFDPIPFCKYWRLLDKIDEYKL